MVLLKWEINCNSYQWSQHKSFEEHAKPVFCVFHLIRVSQKSLYPNHRGITQAIFWGPGYDHFLWLGLYFNATVKLLEPFSKVTPRARCCHSTDITLLRKPRLASNFWPWWAQHVQLDKTDHDRPAAGRALTASSESGSGVRPHRAAWRELVQPVSTSRLQAAAAAQPQSPPTDSCASGFR